MPYFGIFLAACSDLAKDRFNSLFVSCVVEYVFWYFLNAVVAVVRKGQPRKVPTLLTCAYGNCTRRLKIAYMDPSPMGGRQGNCGWPL